LNAHPTYVAMFIIASYVMLLGQSFHEKRYFTPLTSVFIHIMLLLVLFLLVVKISFITIFLILLTFIIFLLFNKRFDIAISSSLILLLIGISVFQVPGVRHRLLNDMETFQNSDLNNLEENRLQERTALWKASWNRIEQHPIVGTSFQGVSSRSSIYTEAKSLYPQLQYAKNSHNNFLEFGVRYGVLGAVLFGLFIILILTVAFKQASFQVMGMWILLCLFSLTESFMFREQGISLVAILIAIFGVRIYGRDI